MSTIRQYIDSIRSTNAFIQSIPSLTVSEKEFRNKQAVDAIARIEAEQKEFAKYYANHTGNLSKTNVWGDPVDSKVSDMYAPNPELVAKQQAEEFGRDILDRIKRSPEIIIIKEEDTKTVVNPIDAKLQNTVVTLTDENTQLKIKNLNLEVINRQNLEQIKKLTAQIEQLEEKLRLTNENLRKLQEEKVELERKLAGVKNLNSKLNDENKKFKNQSSEMQQELQQLRDRLQAQTTTKQEEINVKIKRMTDEKETLERRLAELQSQLETADTAARQAEEKKQQELAALQTNLNDQARELQSVRDQLAKGNEKVAGLTEQLKEEKARHAAELARINDEKEAKNAELLASIEAKKPDSGLTEQINTLEQRIAELNIAHTAKVNELNSQIQKLNEHNAQLLRTIESKKDSDEEDQDAKATAAALEMNEIKLIRQTISEQKIKLERQNEELAKLEKHKSDLNWMGKQYRKLLYHAGSHDFDDFKASDGLPIDSNYDTISETIRMEESRQILNPENEQIYRNTIGYIQNLINKSKLLQEALAKKDTEIYELKQKPKVDPKQIDSLRAQIAEKDRAIEAMLNEKQQVEAEKERLNGNIASINGKLVDLTRQMEEYKANLKRNLISMGNKNESEISEASIEKLQELLEYSVNNTNHRLNLAIERITELTSKKVADLEAFASENKEENIKLIDLTIRDLDAAGKYRDGIMKTPITTAIAKLKDYKRKITEGKFDVNDITPIGKLPDDIESKFQLINAEFKNIYERTERKHRETIGHMLTEFMTLYKSIYPQESIIGTGEFNTMIADGKVDEALNYIKNQFEKTVKGKNDAAELIRNSQGDELSRKNADIGNLLEKNRKYIIFIMAMVQKIQEILRDPNKENIGKLWEEFIHGNSSMIEELAEDAKSIGQSPPEVLGGYTTSRRSKTHNVSNKSSSKHHKISGGFDVRPEKQSAFLGTVLLLGIGALLVFLILMIIYYLASAIYNSQIKPKTNFEYDIYDYSADYY